jgi:hypothetical protein
VTLTLCVEGYAAVSLNSSVGAAALELGIAAYLAGANAAVASVELVSATDGCGAASGRRHALAVAPAAASVTLRALAVSRVASIAVTAAVRALNAPATAAPCVMLAAQLQSAGLGLTTGAWLAPAVSTPSSSPLAEIAAAVAATVGVPNPPSPPPSPPWPPAFPAPPGAMGGAGGATNRHAVLATVAAATSAGAAIGYALAAIVVLWLPVHMAFHAATAAHVRRTAVSFAVALQCEPTLEHGSSDLHSSFKRALSGRLEHELTPEETERSVQHGRRFGAPGLAAVAAAYFGSAAGAKVAVRPLLRAPLMAALGGHSKGQEAGNLALRKKPKGVLWRLKRALQSELDWHGRAARHAWRSIRRMLTPRLTVVARAARAGPGHAFRLVHADEWLGADAAPCTAAIFELSVSFGAGGRNAAAAFRATLRDATQLRELEDAFAACISDAEEAGQRKSAAPSLGVRRAGVVLLALLDDEPHARLDAKQAPGGHSYLPRAAQDAEKPDARSTGLSPVVAERLGALLVLCLKEKDAAARRSSQHAAGRSPAGSPRMAVLEEEDSSAAPPSAARGELLVMPFAVTVHVPDSPSAREEEVHEEEEPDSTPAEFAAPLSFEAMAAADVREQPPPTAAQPPSPPRPRTAAPSPDTTRIPTITPPADRPYTAPARTPSPRPPPPAAAATTPTH